MFRITRVYSDSNGDSRFEYIEIPLKEAGSIGRFSGVIPAKGIMLREVDPSCDLNLHTANKNSTLFYLR